MAESPSHDVAGNAALEIEDASTPQVPTNDNLFHLELLLMIKIAQQQHGLRHGDYQRYRQYCSRRIRRIRKSLNFQQVHHRRIQLKKITVVNCVDSRFLLLKVVEAERCWSYAMMLKDESKTEFRKRFHMLRRMKKSLVHAENLHQLAKECNCDVRTKLECEAYYYWIRGSLHFELQEWKFSKDVFTKAQLIYGKLAETIVDDSKKIYVQRVSEISPNIRYCAYSIGDASAVDDLQKMRLESDTGLTLTSKLDEMIESIRESQATSLSEVKWRGHTLPVKNEAVRIFLLNVGELEKQLENANSDESKISILEGMQKGVIEAQESLREENKDDTLFKSGIRGQLSAEEDIPSSVRLYGYLMYLKLTKTVDRTLLMINTVQSSMEDVKKDSLKIVKPQDIARLYDNILQNFSELNVTPGLEDDSAFIMETKSQSTAYKAFRCYYIGQTYQCMNKFPQAIALYEQVSKYCSSSINLLKGKTDKKKLLKDLEELSAKVDSEKCTIHAQSLLTNEEAKLSDKPYKVPLKERMNEYYESSGSEMPNIIPFPPDFEAIFCKPLFFDLAQGFLEFPPLEEKLESNKKPGGLTSIVKGWLWGSKK